MTDAALMFKLQKRHAELFYKACRGFGSRIDDIELEVLERRMTELRKSGKQQPLYSASGERSPSQRP